MSVNETNPAVVCRSLTKDYGSGESMVRALRGVDLDVFFGELTLLVGPSGCGKTTLLSVIAGILKPTAGSLQVLGTDVGRLSSSRIVRFRRDNIGFVFQQYNLLPALTAAENVTVPLILAGWSRRKALVKAMELLERMGMGPRAHALPPQLSGGQQQRVAIARALIHHPRLLVCDEPTSALDETTGHSIMELLREIAVEGDRAVVIVTHDPRVFGFGDRIARMNDGRIITVERQIPTEHGSTVHQANTPQQTNTTTATNASNGNGNGATHPARSHEVVTTYGYQDHR